MSQSIGHYRYPIFGCAPGWGEVYYTTKPIYGTRQGNHGLQVLIRWFDEMTWINARSSDVIINRS